MIIYVDVLLIVNFIITYFLLIASAIISGYTYNRKRIIASAFAGAIACLYIFVQSDTVVIDYLYKLLSLVLSSVIAFGVKNKRKLTIQAVCFVMLNALLMGVVALISVKSNIVYKNNIFFYININPVLLVISSAAVYIVILLFCSVKEKITPEKIEKINICLNGQILKDMAAFYDSGFKIKDILSNKDVMIADYEKIRNMLNKTMQTDIENFLKGDYRKVKSVFVPVFFNTISGSGILPAIKADYIDKEGKRITNILVAFTDNRLSENVDVIYGNSIKQQLQEYL